MGAYTFVATSLLMLVITVCVSHAQRDADSAAIPAPVADAPRASVSSEQKAVLAGGCFWGIEAVFQHVRGVKDAISGYSGGSAETAHYDLVGMGSTGHAESVEVTFDASQVSYGQLLHVFFSVAHDPTQLNRQGPDIGPQYRSAIFYANEEQKRIAEAYIKQLDASKVFSRPLVTQVVPLTAFYKAEDYHQDYAAKHPDQPYIRFHDAPKVANLKRQFPELYTED